MWVLKERPFRGEPEQFWVRGAPLVQGLVRGQIPKKQAHVIFLSVSTICFPVNHLFHVLSTLMDIRQPFCFLSTIIYFPQLYLLANNILSEVRKDSNKTRMHHYNFIHSMFNLIPSEYISVPATYRTFAMDFAVQYTKTYNTGRRETSLLSCLYKAQFQACNVPFRAYNVVRRTI